MKLIAQLKLLPTPEQSDTLKRTLRTANTAANYNIYTSTALNGVRHRHRRLRAKLQRRRTKSKRRRLQKLSGKEKCFAMNTNHVISKRIVRLAERTKRAIALEDLKGIRARARVRRQQRARLHSWSFGQLRSFIEYKARMAGLPIACVDPWGTSRECPDCGHTSKSNRSSRAVFLCTSCGAAGHADVIAARNISGRAVVVLPNVSEALVSVAPGTSLLL